MERNGSVPGQWPWPAPEYKENPLLRIFGLSRVFREALVAFARRPECGPTPCEIEPEIWTTPAGSAGETNLDAVRRVLRAAAGCRECPAFSACQDLRKALDPSDPELIGTVLAGELIQWGKGPARRAHEALREKYGD